MIGLTRIVVLMFLCATAYVAAPFYAAWTIREAAKTGDVGYLKDKVDWVAIRPGLKDSLTTLAIAPSDLTTASSARQSKPGLWTRMKHSATQFFIHNFVDRYANAGGFETLVTYGRNISRKRDEEIGLSIWERISRVWARVKRAKFTSLTRFELDLVDKDDAHRLYAGVLELRGLQWTVTELRIRTLPVAQVAQLIR